jgi:hypothetical protein
MTATLPVAAFCVLAAIPIASHVGSAEDSGRGSGVGMQLTQVREVRQARLSGESPSFDRPGLTLTFGLDLPAGAQLVELREPESLRAVDSTGLDLTDVELGFSGKREYLDVVHAWEGEPKEATLTLALPRRRAATVSVEAEIEAVVCSGTEIVEVAAGSSPGALRTDVAGFPEAKIHVERKGGQLQVVVSPGTVKGWIEDVAVVAGGAAHESNSAMWSDQQLVYFVEAPAEAAEMVRLTVRRELRAIPVRLELAGVVLP